jgi:RND family efflux transporter MFP subunit
VNATYLRVWNLGKPKQQFVLYTVTKADLPIVITERGSLESQIRTEIRCEVENSSVDRSGTPGTQIIFIVPNGSAVKQGDLLVELDSASIRDRLDRQTLDLQKAKSSFIQARAKYENQVTQNETAEAEAKLKCDLAELQLQMYMDKESGEYKLALDEIDRGIDEAKNLILESQAALELQKTEKSGIQTLFELGYRANSDLQQSRFKFLQAEDKLSAAMNKLTTGQASRHQMERYVQQMKQKSLQGDLDTALRSLKQVKTDNESKLEQAKAAKDEAESAEAKETERLAKLKTQLDKCKIFAPHDGMAVYSRESRYSNDTEISEGVTVRERQQILDLPDLSRMQVKTQIHEAVLDQIQPGLPVTIRVDAFPNRRYVGLVEDVAVVPTSSGWSGSSVKTYDCVIRIPERVESLKPGMTAIVDIHADRIRNVLAVPVQAVFQIDKDHWCYIDGPAGAEKRKVELGRSNDKFVHITNGLALDNRVVLNPMSLLEATSASDNEIGPDDAPEVPDLPIEKTVERIADNKGATGGTSGKATGPKGKGKRPPRTGAKQKTGDTSQPAPTSAAAGS